MREKTGYSIPISLPGKLRKTRVRYLKFGWWGAQPNDIIHAKVLLVPGVQLVLDLCNVNFV